MMHPKSFARKSKRLHYRAERRIAFIEDAIHIGTEARRHEPILGDRHHDLAAEELHMAIMQRLAITDLKQTARIGLRDVFSYDLFGMDRCRFGEAMVAAPVL